MFNKLKIYTAIVFCCVLFASVSCFAAAQFESIGENGGAPAAGSSAPGAAAESAGQEMASGATAGESAENSGLVVLHPKSVGEGEPFVLELGGNVNVDDLEVVWLGKTIPLAGQGSEAMLMLAVPLAPKEAELPLLIRTKEGWRVYSVMIEVQKKEFQSQSLKVDPRFVNPPEAELARIKREREKNRAIYNTITPKRYWSGNFKRPLPGIITSEFGVKRLFNGEPRSRHTGVDFRGAEGVEIRSLAAGKVVLAENQYYSGNVTIVDHGFGLYTIYCHMSAFKAKVGDMLETGQLVGLVGMTGRVTGPHLHLSVMVLGTSVTPEPLMPDFRAGR